MGGAKTEKKEAEGPYGLNRAEGRNVANKCIVKNHSPTTENTSKKKLGENGQEGLEENTRNYGMEHTWAKRIGRQGPPCENQCHTGQKKRKKDCKS